MHGAAQYYQTPECLVGDIGAPQAGDAERSLSLSPANNSQEELFYGFGAIISSGIEYKTESGKNTDNMNRHDAMVEGPGGLLGIKAIDLAVHIMCVTM